MNRLAAELRSAARSALPEGAFLRRDRGEALFVTDALRLRPGADVAASLAGAGFRCAGKDGLLYLCPDAGWPERLEREYPTPPDALCESFFRFAGLPVEDESLALFALGARLLDGGGDGGRFEQRLRQRAAVCMRLNRTGRGPSPSGGGLYACALLLRLIKEEN